MRRIVIGVIVAGLMAIVACGGKQIGPNRAAPIIAPPEGIGTSPT